MWTKTGSEFPLECAAADLTDAAYRTHHEALTWVMYREAGPVISHRDVERLAESPDRETAVKELVDRGFWKVVPGGYQIVHHMEHQPTPTEIKKRRKRGAERAAKHRQKKQQEQPEDPHA